MKMANRTNPAQSKRPAGLALEAATLPVSAKPQVATSMITPLAQKIARQSM